LKAPSMVESKRGCSEACARFLAISCGLEP
jgi:hypothetical protein